MGELISIERIEHKIYLLRGQKVMLDYDLAELYCVETKHLKRQIRRNKKRFPPDFVFQLTRKENLRCQNVTSSYGGRRYLPYVFAEQGIAMLSSVLHSERAVIVNIAIMRTFVRLRRILLNHKELAYKLLQIEQKIEKHDKDIQTIFEAIRQLMLPPEKPKQKIGFLRDREAE